MTMLMMMTMTMTMTFYVLRKVEEATRKGETQLRALKRGEGGTSGNAAGGGAPDDVADAADLEVAAAADSKSGAAVASAGATVVNAAEYERKLQMMQAELARVTGELEQAKQGLVTAQAAVSTAPTVVPGTSAPAKPTDASSSSSHDRDQQQQVHAAELELLRLQATKDAELKAKEERLKWQQQQHALQQTFDEEKAALLQRVRDEESRASQLAAEIARMQARVDGQPQTPQMMQFNAMEQHLKLLEARTDRRERELVAAVEEVSEQAVD